MTRDQKVQKAIQDGVQRNLISQDELNLINKGELELLDKEYYIKKALGAAAGIRKMIEESDDKAVGITNFQNGRLPKGKTIVVTHIKVESAVDASVTGAKYASVIGAPAVANGEFDLSQGGREIFVDQPIQSLLPLEETKTAADNYVELDRPFILTSESPISLLVEFPQATAANTNVSFSFKGLQFNKK